MRIALTGVTGNLGGKVASLLQDKGMDLRYLARNPGKLAHLPATQVYQAAYNDTPETVEALRGVDVLFMVSAGENPKRLEEHKSFVDAAALAGVGQIVYISFYNVSKTSSFTLGRDHYYTEEYIKEKGLGYTFIRDNFYMDFFLDLAKSYGEFRAPAGEGKVSLVLRSDIAEVAAKILEDPSRWENQTLNMTGPQELSLQEIADVIGEKLGKEIPYIRETVEEAYASRKKWEAEQWEYDSWVSTYTGIAKGEQAGISPDIERVLGRPATSLAEFLDKSL